MKKTIVLPAVVCMAILFACSKPNDFASQISLTASTTQASVGQTVAVTVSTNLNASKWSVTPSAAAQTYSITASKTNYFKFSQAGVYTVSVSAKAAGLDSSTSKSLDSCWNHAGHGACVKGIDSASLNIIVTE